MKAGIHPNYREVVFHDLSCDFKFITRSTVQTRETINFEGKDYPLVKIEVSSDTRSSTPPAAWKNSARSSAPWVPRRKLQRNNSTAPFEKAAQAAFFISRYFST